ncbi:MAG: SDR family oxidoreductase [Polyangiaceae bacterium]|nr:SDR family oxidoreductase [Polyangiaceae bacterium]
MSSVFRNDILAGKVAFVTGGGSGIGRGITRAMMAHGADAVIVGRNADRLATTARELGVETGRACLAHAADVREPAAVEAAIDTALAAFGRIDVVVNGAAGNFLAPAAGLSYNGFRTVMAIDALGTYNVCKAAFDRRLRDHGGNIINVSATLHYGATPLQTHAAAAKAAVDSLTRSLALEWGSLGIRVNAIAPGPIGETEGVKRLAPGDMGARLLRTIPIGRYGTIDEIASVALFLASDGSSLVNGAVVVADGGAWLGAARVGAMLD